MTERGLFPHLKASGYRPIQSELASANFGIAGVFRVRLCPQCRHTKHAVCFVTGEGIAAVLSNHIHGVPSSYLPDGWATQLPNNSISGMDGHSLQ